MTEAGDSSSSSSFLFLFLSVTMTIFGAGMLLNGYAPSSTVTTTCTYVPGPNSPPSPPCPTTVMHPASYNLYFYLGTGFVSLALIFGLTAAWLQLSQSRRKSFDDKIVLEARRNVAEV
ncbi:MAG: hypothetical protein JRN15_13460 [Nitrososphaerota archaeon]|nr:hypothetical protein [Nitrososphaerota archaeon]